MADDGYLVEGETLRRFDAASRLVLNNRGADALQNRPEVFQRRGGRIFKTPAGGITTSDPTQPGSAVCTLYEWNGAWTQLTATATTETVYSLENVAGNTLVRVQNFAGRAFVVPVLPAVGSMANASYIVTHTKGGSPVSVYSGFSSTDTAKFQSPSSSVRSSLVDCFVSYSGIYNFTASALAYTAIGGATDVYLDTPNTLTGANNKAVSIPDYNGGGSRTTYRLDIPTHIRPSVGPVANIDHSFGFSFFVDAADDERPVVFLGSGLLADPIAVESYTIRVDMIEVLI
jgi:hypothetical protein